MQLPVCGDPRVLGSVLFSPSKDRVEVFANMSEAKNESASRFVCFFFLSVEDTKKNLPASIGAAKTYVDPQPVVANLFG